MAGRQTGRALATLVVLLLVAALAPAVVSAATLSGTVTAEGGGPIEGIRVCPTPEPYGFEVECVATDGSGHYQLTDLPASDYYVHFSAAEGNLPYVDEWYADAHEFSEADLLQLEADAIATVDVAMTAGGSIAGTLSDESSGQPVEGMAACAINHGGVASRCVRSDAEGDYQVNGLPSGVYSVEFESWNYANYLHEFYEDSEDWAGSTDVTVTAPATTAGIDAELTQGGEILGRVTEVGTGTPLQNALVCAEEPGPGERRGCEWTDTDGYYAIRGLPAGAYLIEFGIEWLPLTGRIVRGYWQDAASLEDADLITITPPQTLTGIDAQIRDPYGPEPEGSDDDPAPAAPAAASTLPAATKPPLRRCRKGFHRKLVKGKNRCVRKHHPRRTHRR